MNVETTAAISSSRTTLRNTENYTRIYTHTHIHLYTRRLQFTTASYTENKKLS